MSYPNQFTTVSDQPAESRDYIPMNRCKGRLLIVRPLEYKREGFVTKHSPDGTDVVFCDIALLDPIPDWVDEYSETHQGYPAGFQFRNQAILQGYLKGTFKRYIGATLIGTIYFGPPTKGKPPQMWQDLSGEPQCVQRGQQFLAARPEFLIPVEAAITEAKPETYGPVSYSSPGYTAPPQDAPGYMQPDPWAATPTAAPVSPAPSQRPQTTLDQLRNMGQTNHQGQPQSSDVPF